MELVFLFKDMQLFNVTLHQNSKFGSLRHGLTFQILNPLSCRRVWKVDLWNIYKNKISQDLCSTVTVNEHTIKDQKSCCCFGNIFILAMVNWIHVVLILTSLTRCSILYFLFIVQHLSTFKHCFCFFGFKHVGSSLTFSVLFLLLCYFNILFYSLHCFYSLWTVYTTLTS